MLPLEPYDLNGFAGGPTHTYNIQQCTTLQTPYRACSKRETNTFQPCQTQKFKTNAMVTKYSETLTKGFKL